MKEKELGSCKKNLKRICNESKTERDESDKFGGHWKEQSSKYLGLFFGAAPLPRGILFFSLCDST